MADDGWSQIPSKGRRKQTPTTQPNGLNPPARDLDLLKIRKDFDMKTKSWKQSQCRKTLHTLLTRIRPESGWNITKAVCLASGSFSRENLECRRRSLWQMVVFVDLAEYLGVKAAYAQEPMYTALDTEFLKTLDISALEMETGTKVEGMGPAKEIVGPDALMYEPFLDMTAPMLEEIIQADVPLYVGSSIRGLRERTTQAGQLAKGFATERGMYKFPVFEVDPNVMDGMEIFWKEEHEDD